MDITLPRISPIGPTGDLPLALPRGTGALGAARSLSLADASSETFASPAQGLVESFGAVLAQAVQDINQAQLAADADAGKLAAGEPVDIHQVMLGMEKANLSFSLALQVRNKLLEAYQEVMRMTV